MDVSSYCTYEFYEFTLGRSRGIRSKCMVFWMKYLYDGVGRGGDSELERFAHEITWDDPK